MLIKPLYEDNHLLVVVKPPNVPAQPDISGDEDMLSCCKAYVKEKYQKPGEVYLGLVHRLDRPVGGVMVFARTSKAAARLSVQLQKGGVHREYVALCTGAVPPSGELEDYLLKDGATNTTTVVGPDAGGKLARLSFTTLGETDGTSLLSIVLESGRSHQIRVQLSHANMPILGDKRYNPGGGGRQICLWACRLSFEHPTQKIPLSFTACPKGGAWNDFLQTLTAVYQS